MEENIVIAFLLTLFAGLATGIGGLIVFFAKQPNKKFLSFALGLSAGVMILVSFGEFLVESRRVLTEEMGDNDGLMMMWGCFFLGILLIGVIDRLIPSFENPHEVANLDNINQPIKKGTKLMRVGLMTACAIALHNFPEGIATLIVAADNPALGIAIAFAVAIHNIPEGIAVAIPIYQVTRNRKKAFLLSLYSGLAEPVGAIVAYFILMPYITPILMGQIFAVIAGIMVFISLDELLPTTHAYGEHHISIYGLIVGMAIMAMSLIIVA